MKKFIEVKKFIELLAMVVGMMLIGAFLLMAATIEWIMGAGRDAAQKMLSKGLHYFKIDMSSWEGDL